MDASYVYPERTFRAPAWHFSYIAMNSVHIFASVSRLQANPISPVAELGYVHSLL